MDIERQQRDWNDLGTVDPLWAIASRDDTRNGRWDVDEFFETGRVYVDEVLAAGERLGLPEQRSVAIDFGCGVGRLTRALAPHFDRCYGLDISPSMIANAKELNAALANCTFQVNASQMLEGFDDGAADLILTQWVLQHLPDAEAIAAYLADFVRVLRPRGLLVFQVRTSLSLRSRIQLGRRIYRVLRSAGLGSEVIYERLKLSPMRLTAISDAQVRAVLDRTGAEVRDVEEYVAPAGNAATYYVTRSG